MVWKTELESKKKDETIFVKIYEIKYTRTLRRPQAAVRFPLCIPTRPWVPPAVRSGVPHTPAEAANHFVRGAAQKLSCLTQKAMEAQLTKVNADVSRLQAEKLQHEKAMEMRSACDDMVKYVNGVEEPFSPTYSGVNPYSSDSGAGCACIIS